MLKFYGSFHGMGSSLLQNQRVQLLIAVTVVCIGIVAMQKPVAQWESYHHFADTRTMLGIPNAMDVLSNLPFLFAGVIGFWLVRKRCAPETRAAYNCFCAGLVLTCFGSEYYHLAPNNDTLVWDRLPMTLAFMSFVAAVMSEYIDVKLGQRALVPLLIIGVASVGYWHWTELRGAGDLRAYGLVQFYPAVLIPLILWLFPKKDSGRLYLLLAVIAYIAAKLLEYSDARIYSMTGFISGHTIKHVVAALAGWLIVRRAVLSSRYPGSS